MPLDVEPSPGTRSRARHESGPNRDPITRRPTRVTLAALGSAVESRRPTGGCIHHSDRGSQYAAEKYRDLLAEHGLRGSMGRRGNPYDNAKAESCMKTPRRST